MFRDMCSRLTGQRITPSDGGVEIVSFVAPRVTIRVMTLWPVVRFRIPDDREPKHDKEYGIDPKAKDHVRDFLERSKPHDISILISHVPPEYLSACEPVQPLRTRYERPPAPQMIQMAPGDTTVGSTPNRQRYILNSS